MVVVVGSGVLVVVGVLSFVEGFSVVEVVVGSVVVVVVVGFVVVVVMGGPGVMVVVVGESAPSWSGGGTMAALTGLGDGDHAAALSIASAREIETRPDEPS